MLLIDKRIVAELRAAQQAGDLHKHLQAAIELEHATIPPYLTAYFTLHLGTNEEIAAIVRSIVIEEMLHMTIAANVLLAIGGCPVIDRPGFIPTYPSPLPMNVGDGLVVGLAKFSRELVHDVFMKIEEPETPLDFPVRAAAEAAAPVPEFATIGEFYRAIIDKIVALGDGIFTGDPGLQVVDPRWFRPDELFPITNVETASAALRLVVEEGEGTTGSPLDQEGEYAHYYRFAEIWHGRRLVPDASVPEGYAYAGPPLPFAADAVWDMSANPKRGDYPAGSLSRQLANRFSFTYTKLLKALHQAFNGRPESLASALGIMYELRLLAQDVLRTPDPSTGLATGLTYEYAPLEM